MKQLLLTLAFLFLVSSNVSAIVIDEGTDPTWFIDRGVSHVDTNTGLEWLDFSNLDAGANTPTTMGISVDNAVATYVPQGWRLASYGQITNLFNTFFGDTFVGDANGKKVTTYEVADDPYLTARNTWLLSFGTNADANDAGTSIFANGDNTTASITSGSLSSRGMYKENGVWNYLGVLLNVDTGTTSVYGPNFQTGLTLAENTGYGNLGVFMVRDYIPEVPVPAAIWLFVSGLIGLIAIGRKPA